MKRQQGFGLIEVMIAFIVVAVTAGSLLQLNKSYLEYSRDGRNREVALRLAESKLDELRYFRNLQGYQNIVSGSESTALDGVTYELDWTVDDYGWDGSAWMSPLLSGITSGKKEVTVTVDWDDPGVKQNFTLASVISPNQSLGGGPFGTGAANQGLGFGGPDVVHNPGTVPSVIPISLGDGITQETSRPLPKLAQLGGTDSLRVALDTNAYNGSYKKFQVQDMVTVSCNCKLSTSKVAYLPSKRAVVSGLSYWVKGENASKMTGVPQQNQDPLCTICCTSHFDGPENKFSHWYDAIKRHNVPPHGHYTAGDTLATIEGNSYLEACRLVRINGFYEMANDWNLVALNIFDASIFADSGVLSAYQSYVKKVVTDYIRGQIKAEGNYNNQTYSTPISFSAYLANSGLATSTTNMMDVAPGPAQLMARGIYVDIISPEYRRYLKDGVMGGDADASPDNLLKFMPFYDVNLTLLADWKSDIITNVSVTSDSVQTMVDSSQQYYGTYSRGLINALKEGTSATISATIRRSNSGITSFKPLSTFETTDVKSSSLDVSVQTVAGKVSVTGKIKCITYETVDATVTELACSDTQLSQVQVGFTQPGIPSSTRCGSTQTSGPGDDKGNLSLAYNCYANNGAEATLTATVPAGYEVVLPASPWKVSVNTSQGGSKSIAGGCLLAVINRPNGNSLPGTCN
ncbi:MAG: hypothetical protein GYB38_02670 [Gammaproteobacteria bacterium]|nr:hypothetical protein [Gammaproteobacteria bacterium]